MHERLRSQFAYALVVEQKRTFATGNSASYHHYRKIE
jgi:hypothetical protein